MNKNELVEQVAGRAGLSRGQAAGAVEAALAAIEAELAADGDVAITGFGRFSVTERAARQARNPRTGEPIDVPAGPAPRFAAGSQLKRGGRLIDPAGCSSGCSSARNLRGRTRHARWPRGRPAPGGRRWQAGGQSRWPSPRRSWGGGERERRERPAPSWLERSLILFEQGHLPVYYFPLEDVREELLEPSEKHTTCPRKGEASYWSVRVADRVAHDAVWRYPEPIDGCPDISRHVAIYWNAMDS